jgi:hypothetical protein
MGATRRNLQVQPKILKKSSKHQIYQSERNSTQNPKKIIGTSEHQIYQSKRKCSQKKVFLVP